MSINYDMDYIQCRLLITLSSTFTANVPPNFSGTSAKNRDSEKTVNVCDDQHYNYVLNRGLTKFDLYTLK